PDRSDITFLLARCQARLGFLDEAEETVAPMLKELGEVPFTLLVRGNIAFDRGRYSESLKLLLQAEKAEPRLPDLHLAIGNTYLRSVRYADAERAFERALEVDPHNAQARLGLAFALLRQRRYDEAAGAAILAVGLQHHLPMAHFYLGCALVRLQLFERAIQAFKMAVNQRGPLYLGHRWLARLYKNRGDEEQAAHHLGEALKYLDQRKFIAAQLQAVREQAQVRKEMRAKSPLPTKKKTIEPQTFTIVSGLPRSGTSLMMQMLQAGGLEVMTDHERAADHDNPEGYFEWEAIKRVQESPEILTQVGNRAVKVVSALIPALPPMHRYRVIFMTRPITEVVASQKKMIDRRRTRGANMTPDKLAEVLIQHRDTILRGLESLPNFEVLEINYPQLVAEPTTSIERVNEFFGGKLNTAAMAGCVNPSLHRNRSSAVEALASGS
ncbi:MAG TPA: tetratricopeptide repeat protein, partial [Chthoniobacterales bacterium]|nr:tetratricopeptide repeat protein [Chthoniobacterales bacterium]